MTDCIDKFSSAAACRAEGSDMFAPVYRASLFEDFFFFLVGDCLLFCLFWRLAPTSMSISATNGLAEPSTTLVKG